MNYLKKCFLFIVCCIGCLIAFGQSVTLMPINSHKDTVCDNIVLYDDGGVDGNHSISCNGTYTFMTPTPGNAFRINVYQNIHAYNTNIASLRIYNGDTNSNDLFFQCNDNGIKSFLVYSTSDTITVKFKSDDDNPLSGFVISIQEVCSQKPLVSYSFEDANTATLSWNALTGVDYYVVEYVDTTYQWYWYDSYTPRHIMNDSSTFTIQTIQTTSTSVTLNNLGSYQYLYYNVYGVDTTGGVIHMCSGNINYCYHQPPCLAVLPTNLTSTYINYDSVLVTWDYVEGVQWYLDWSSVPLDTNFYALSLNCNNQWLYFTGDTTGTASWCNYSYVYLPSKKCYQVPCTSEYWTDISYGPFDYNNYNGYIFNGGYYLYNSEQSISKYLSEYIGVKDVTHNSITITWELPSGEEDTLTTNTIISWKKANDTYAPTLYDTIPSTSTVYTITGLDTNTTYTVGVELLCDYCQQHTYRDISTILGTCLDFTDFYSNNTYLTWGDYNNPYDSFIDTLYSKAYYYRLNDTNNVWFAFEQDDRHLVIRDTNEVDWNTNGQLRKIPQGEVASVRLGNSGVGREAESIAYQYTVDTNEYDMIILKYAVVMQDPAHNRTNQPRFKLDILDENGNLIDSTCSSADFYAAGDLGWNEVTGSNPKIIWKDWTTIGIGLSQYHGQTIRIRFTTYDCDEGGHYGYAYFNLHCEKAHIYLINRCDAEDSIHLTAPYGFEYAWTRNDNPTILSTDADYIAPIDTNVYHCKASFIGKPECYFTISTQSINILPIAQASYKIDTCSSTITFYDESYMEFDTTYYAFTKQMIDSTFWIFDDTVFVSADSIVRQYPENGIYDVKLVCLLSNSGCVDTLKMNINIDFHRNVTINALDNICLGDTLELSFRGIDKEKDTFTWNTGETSDTIKVVPTLGDTNYWVDFAIYGKCNSRADKNIIINIPYYDTINADICEGTTYNQYNFSESEQGVYTQHLTSIDGCDSVVTLNLTVRPKYDDTLYAIGCGTGYSDNGFDVTESGLYLQSLQSIYGCDSIVRLDFKYVEPFTDTITEEVYSGQKYNFMGQEYSESGIYTTTYTDMYGCDSIYVLDLTVTKLSFPTAITPNGDGINDVFSIRGLLEENIFNETTLIIYNRYGRQIYKNDRFNVQKDFWDPNATNTATGTFFYRFIAKGKKKNIDFTGSVEVIR